MTVSPTGPMHLRLRFACGDTFAIGPGKADLLDAIDREGSIAAAGRALGMSYRRTRLLVDEMNRCFHERLVETLAGGGRERGARLTPFGQDMLAAYRALVAQAAAIRDDAAYARLTAGIRAAPIPAKA